jgi:hypothetical protein
VVTSDGIRIVRLGTAPLTQGGDYAGGNLLLQDHAGRVRLRVILDENDVPAIEFLDADGNVTWSQR